VGKASGDVPAFVPEIRNIIDVGDEPEPVAYVHFTGEQWREAIREVRVLTDENQLPVGCDSTGGLRFRRLGGSRGDVLVGAQEPSCLGSPGDRVETVCIQIPIRRGGILTFECHCFERPVPPEERERQVATCRVGFHLDDGLKATCVSDNCNQCLGPIGWSTGYWTGRLDCHCMDRVLGG